jgi:hypothetical protein
VSPTDLRELAGENLRLAAPALEMFYMEQLIDRAMQGVANGDEALQQAGRCRQLAVIIQQIRSAANPPDKPDKPLMGLKPLHIHQQPKKP